MTKEELRKATGQELIEERDYCGRDNYYRDYLDNVNAEMLKRFNRLAELEQELTVEKDLHQEEINLHLHAEEYIKSLEKENAELKEESDFYNKERGNYKAMYLKEILKKNKAIKIISEFVEWANWEGSKCPSFKSIQDKAEQYLKEIEK